MKQKSEEYNKAQLEHRIICDSVETGSRILDLGCGSGDLMLLLEKEKNTKGHGIELKEEAIYECVKKGLNVLHGDIEGGLTEYPDKSFDYVILNESMQEAKNAEYVIDEALRVGKKVIIGFPNFANIRASAQLFFIQKTPITKAMPFKWYNTPNLHFLTIRDFVGFCKDKNIKILQKHCLTFGKIVKFWPSLIATNAIFVIAKNHL